MDKYFLTVCLNPVLQKTIVLNNFREDEVNRCQSYFSDAAGKGINVTRVLKQLDNDVVHLTQAGWLNRDSFLQLTNTDGLTVSWVESNSRIRNCYTLLNTSCNTTTEIVEEGDPVDKKTESRIWTNFLELLPASQIVIISGSKAAGFSSRIFPEMVKVAKKQKKYVILDYRGEDLIESLVFKPDIIKPNYLEFVQTFFPNPALVKTRESVILKMQNLYADYKIKTVLTMGEKGVLYHNGDGVFSAEAIQEIVPVNTTGCGDSFTAGFASAVNCGKDFENAILFGQECAVKNAVLINPGVIV